MRDSAAQIVVVGGGLSGALVALHVATQRPGADLVVIERCGTIGRGLAYGSDVDRQLNVAATGMDLGFEPSFLTWLHGQGVAADGADFLPRRWFGAYVNALTQGRGVRVIRGDVVAISPEGPCVRLACDRTIRAKRVVLALGSLPRAPEAGPMRADPWSAEALTGLDPKSRVLLLGSGLTAADLALTLDERGHRGPIVALSRSGLAPAVQPAGAIGRWTLDARLGSARGVTEAFRLARSEAQRAASAGGDWRGVVDALRGEAQGLWSRWSDLDRARFLRHARRYWDIHRHRMPEAAAERLRRMAAEGRFSIVAGRLLELAGEEPTLHARVRLRAAADPQLWTAARVIDCRGLEFDCRASPAPLVQDLLRSGLARADPLGLGLLTRDGALVGAEGLASDWLFALGPLTRGALWEVTAAREINAQARELAGRLVK